jgi:uncharacterized RDD family membrane protein YckC
VSVQTAIPRPATSSRPGPRPPVLRHAGFWIRLVAGIIDLAILAIPLAVFASFWSVGVNNSRAFLRLHPGQSADEVTAQFGASFSFYSTCFFLATSWLYFAIMESSVWRATVGKRALGLHVGDARGDRLGFWRASLRFFCGRLLLHVPQVGAYYFLVDCVYIGLNASKRAIHDLLSGCLVLRGKISSAPLA